jgi:hypothetical protein
MSARLQVNRIVRRSVMTYWTPVLTAVHANRSYAAPQVCFIKIRPFISISCWRRTPLTEHVVITLFWWHRRPARFYHGSHNCNVSTITAWFWAAAALCTVHKGSQSLQTSYTLQNFRFFLWIMTKQQLFISYKTEIPVLSTLNLKRRRQKGDP